MFNKQQCRTEGRFSGKCGGWGHRGWGAPWSQAFQGNNRRVPANIEETDANFIISLYAAGLKKENIRLSVKEDILTISYNGNETQHSEGQGKTDAFTYREYTNGSFERRFFLNNKVSIDSIAATYADGILTVTLPKNPETNKPAQDIRIG